MALLRIEETGFYGGIAHATVDTPVMGRSFNANLGCRGRVLHGMRPVFGPSRRGSRVEHGQANRPVASVTVAAIIPRARARERDRERSVAGRRGSP
jgi:hypothetical protein